MPGWPPGIWFDERQLAHAIPGRRRVRDAHLPHVAVLFHRRLLRAAAVPETRRAFVLGKPRCKRILIPLVVGWVMLFPIIAFLWMTGITKVFGGTLPPMPAMPRPGRISAHAPVVPLSTAPHLRGGRSRFAASSRVSIRRRNCAASSTRRSTASIRTMTATFTLGFAGRRGAHDVADLVLLAGHPDTGPVTDSADPGVGRFRHRIRLRLADPSLE